MQSSADLDYDKIKSDIENIEEVKNIHHVHTWLTDERTIYFEAHIDLKDMMISEAEKVYEKISHLLKEHYNVHHITLQFETGRCEDKKMF
jgi:cobalt-zinc-cadmium efflux system protein